MVLSCIDSRIPVETIFDQGIGDVFSARVAGNFVNTDILGSIEFACAASTARLIMVLGHTACGAVKGACDVFAEGSSGGTGLNNLDEMLENIKPAVDEIKEPVLKPGEKPSDHPEYVNKVAVENVRMTIDNLRAESETLDGLIKDGTVLLMGGMYDVKTGKVDFWKPEPA